MSLKLNPKTLKGEERVLYNHQFVCLNPNYSDESTPQPIREWLDFIYQSIHNSERAVINLENKGIRRAAELISFENLTPEERTLSKNKESAQIVIAKIENAKSINIARRLLVNGISVDVVAQSTELNVEYVQKLKDEQ